MLSCFSHVRLFATPWTGAPRSSVRGILRGTNTGVGCYALLQRIFPTQGSNPRLFCLLHWHLESSINYPMTQQSHYWSYAYPKKTITERDTCTPVFTAALFTIARICWQIRCSSKDKWIKKLWYIYTMEH